VWRCRTSIWRLRKNLLILVKYKNKTIEQISGLLAQDRNIRGWKNTTKERRTTLKIKENDSRKKERNFRGLFLSNWLDYK